jgi:hypothetical protein
MSLIRKKVQEFENINGFWSISEQAPNENSNDLTDESNTKQQSISNTSVISSEHTTNIQSSESNGQIRSGTPLNEASAGGSSSNLIGESMSLSDLINNKNETSNDVEMKDNNEDNKINNEKQVIGKLNLTNILRKLIQGRRIRHLECN